MRHLAQRRGGRKPTHARPSCEQFGAKTDKSQGPILLRTSLSRHQYSGGVKTHYEVKLPRYRCRRDRDSSPIKKHRCVMTDLGQDGLVLLVPRSPRPQRPGLIVWLIPLPRHSSPQSADYLYILYLLYLVFGRWVCMHLGSICYY